MIFFCVALAIATIEIVRLFADVPVGEEVAAHAGSRRGAASEVRGRRVANLKTFVVLRGPQRDPAIQANGRLSSVPHRRGLARAVGARSLHDGEGREQLKPDYREDRDGDY